VTFKDKTLLVADLHLQSEEPATLSLALSFFAQAEEAKHLYILGDLFEFWLGDDCPPTALEDTLPKVVDALSAISNSGTAITLMHGNRDFLLGEQFASRVGATLVRDDTIELQANATSITLMHGDTLCTDDVEYQQFRLKVRDTDWQASFLAKAAEEREAIATAMRSGSVDASQTKTKAIMDVNDDAVAKIFTEHRCRYLVHGHTHRPAIHEHQVDERSHSRIVVGDWHADHAMVAVIDASGEAELVRFSQHY